MRLGARLLIGLVLLTPTQGCDTNVTTSNSTDATSACDPRSYDLRRPPSRDDLGMPAGESVLDVSCDEGFDLSLALPEDAATSLTARRVNADSYGSGSVESGEPTTMDVHSVGLDTDAALQTARRVAGDLGMDAAPLARWRAEVEARGGDNVDSPFLRTKLDYLTAELQVQHLAASGTSYVHLILTWG